MLLPEQCYYLCAERQKNKKQGVKKQNEKSSLHSNKSRYHYGNRWIINYIQLEQVIAEFFAKTDYKIRRLKRKKVRK